LIPFPSWNEATRFADVPLAAVVNALTSVALGTRSVIADPHPTATHRAAVTRPAGGCGRLMAAWPVHTALLRMSVVFPSLLLSRPGTRRPERGTKRAVRSDTNQEGAACGS
jgi:hypothetical protein